MLHCCAQVDAIGKKSIASWVASFTLQVFYLNFCRNITVEATFSSCLHYFCSADHAKLTQTGMMPRHACNAN